MNILIHTLPILLVLAVHGSPTTKDETPQVHLYYEPLCIDCRNYWEQEFYPFYQKYSKSGKVGFHINPYGNRSPNFPDPPCQVCSLVTHCLKFELLTKFPFHSTGNGSAMQPLLRSAPTSLCWGNIQTRLSLLSPAWKIILCILERTWSTCIKSQKR